ncbi:MAG TPA: hypothetical protein VLA31_07800 [Burkholderiaceae bacterium]|nr:hypothetical protein [Burkholderiaceae bacterium]
MKNSSRLPGRPTVGTLALLLMLVFTALDLLAADPIDPYQAPYPTALGSGQVPSGGHCTDISALRE